MIERADTLNNQAIILASDGAYKEAIACFKRALVIDKSNSLLWFNLGVTYRDGGDLEEAEKALATAYKIAPDNGDIQETYATTCLMQKKYAKTREICEESLDLNPLNAHLFNLLGVVEFQNESYDEAAEWFEEAVYINPYYLDARYNLKDTYSQLKNRNGEIECDRKIKELKN